MIQPLFKSNQHYPTVIHLSMSAQINKIRLFEMKYNSIPQRQLQLETIEGKPANEILRINSSQGYFFFFR